MARPLRVMLADDHETVRQGLRALFRSVPEVDVVLDVADGNAAIDAARTIALDLVVLDLSMRPTGGLSVMQRIMEARRQPKFVVLTRYREPSYVREAIAAGASGYVLKQSPFSELLRAVEAVGRGGQHLDPALAGKAPRLTPFTGLGTASDLTERETDVFRRAALGHTNKAIAGELSIAVKTVEVHKSRAMKKLGLRNRIEVIRYASSHGWLQEA